MNSKSNYHYRGKLLFTSLAAATLGLIIISPDMAKADTLVDSAAKKQVAQSSSLPASNNNQTAASTDSAANNNQASTTSEAAASNETQPSTSPGSEAQDANEPPAAGAEAKGITPRSVLTASWGGINVTFDTDSGIATIPGGTITDPDSIIFLFEEYRSMKTIKITGPLKIIGNASYLFYGLINLTEIEGLDKVDTAEVTDMTYMFSNCHSLANIDVSNFDTSKVTSMYFMFGANNVLTNLDVSNFDTSKVTSMKDMFRWCPSLRTLNISNFQMAQVTDKSEMLNSLPNLSTLVLGPNNYIQGTGLDTTGTWLNVGNGTVDKPQGNKRWTSSQLMDNYSGSRDQDTYVRLGEAVTVHYRDEAGATLAPDQILSGRIGESYSSEPQDIAGYVLKTTPENAKGTYTDKVQEVTYVYTKNAPVNPGGTAGRQPIVGGSVTVHYQDETGKQLAPDQILTGNVGEGYLTQEVTLAGYKLIQRPANATGFYTANPQSVTYIYTKNVTGQAAVRRTVFHNSYLYDQNGGRKTGKYLMGKTIWTYGTRVIQGKKYYDLGQDSYVKATNVSGVKRKLRRNSYIYSKTAKKLQRKALKKGQKVTTYGAAVKIHRKLYYIVGKNQYVKKSNF
ncbi:MULTISPECIES: MucBP domain-containing protein [unclassified Lactobacillus]|uniref:MucBP domain-containing protein n=1 Tax=unclassified Lactobacillus TaxID=2620435 RepID=UPI0018DDD10D|nr:MULTISPECIES: MucBP domain-containing protein [unclassified Lactobacillus]MBH9989314.1 MucBP domain-containing protein [Lactobacillus sp. M0392]MBI0023925.1 MucBP domain-containing protein [Lactobacillus sp. W8171]MBI0044355.1 MucBP domain-containing protein [Lactobacillus sp. M0393]